MSKRTNFRHPVRLLGVIVSSGTIEILTLLWLLP